MDVHKPKPIRSWRELFTEIGVIVLSVCIALAAEQAVEWWHWRGQVNQAREAIATEMAQNVWIAILHMRSLDCGERRLDALTDILDAASVSGRLPPLGDIGMSPRALLSTGAWDSVVASQIATHFPRQQLTDLSSIYARVSRIMSRSDTEDWVELNTMSGPGRRLDPAAEQDLRKALTRARFNGRFIARVAGLVADGVKAQNLPFSVENLATIADARNRPLSDGRTFLLCQPIGAPPARYGQAPLSTWSAQVREKLKHLPDFGAR